MRCMVSPVRHPALDVALLRSFVAAHSTILLHIIFASITLPGAVVPLIWSGHSHGPLWIVVSAVGLAFVILAFARGEQYVSTMSNTDLSNGGIGWFGAIATHGVGWYLNHKAVVLRAAAS